MWSSPQRTRDHFTLVPLPVTEPKCSYVPAAVVHLGEHKESPWLHTEYIFCVLFNVSASGAAISIIPHLLFISDRQWVSILSFFWIKSKTAFANRDIARRNRVPGFHSRQSQTLHVLVVHVGISSSIHQPSWLLQRKKNKGFFFFGAPVMNKSNIT